MALWGAWHKSRCAPSSVLYGLTSPAAAQKHRPVHTHTHTHTHTFRLKCQNLKSWGSGRKQNETSRDRFIRVIYILVSFIPRFQHWPLSVIHSVIQFWQLMHTLWSLNNSNTETVCCYWWWFLLILYILILLYIYIYMCVCVVCVCVFIYLFILASLFLCVRIDVKNFILVTTGANVQEERTVGYQDGDFAYLSTIWEFNWFSWTYLFISSPNVACTIFVSEKGGAARRFPYSLVEQDCLMHAEWPLRDELTSMTFSPVGINSRSVMVTRSHVYVI